MSFVRRQKVLKQHAVVVKAACKGEACSVTATGKVSIHGQKKALQLESATKRVPAGHNRRFKLGLSKRARAAIAKALRRRTLNAKIVVTAKDGAGNVARRTITIKLVRAS